MNTDLFLLDFKNRKGTMNNKHGEKDNLMRPIQCPMLQKKIIKSRKWPVD